MRVAQICAGGLLALGITTATAGSHENLKVDISDPITVRMSLMGNIGASMKALGGMAKGDIEYNAALADASLRTIYASAAGFAAQFPEDSKDGHNTEASLKIWDDRDGFNAAAAKFVADAEAAVMSKPSDADALKTAFGQVASNCRACHTDYRAKR